MSISVKQRKICRPKLKSAAFIRAIPLAWVQQAARLPGKALHVALVIWYQVGVEKSGTIRFSMKLSRQFGVLRACGFSQFSAFGRGSSYQSRAPSRTLAGSDYARRFC